MGSYGSYAHCGIPDQRPPKTSKDFQRPMAFPSILRYFEMFEVTNAISGIIVVGGMLQLSGPVLSARVACALAAVFLSSVNIVGGFAVTARMLEMFREDAKPR